MGLNFSKERLEPVENPTLSMSPYEAEKLEKIYDKLDSDILEQHRVIEKYLIDDEIQYKKDVEEYRTKNHCYVITDRKFIERAENLMFRKSIIWR